MIIKADGIILQGYQVIRVYVLYVSHEDKYLLLHVNETKKKTVTFSLFGSWFI